MANKITLDLSEKIMEFTVEEPQNGASAIGVIKPGRDPIAMLASRWLQQSRTIDPLKCLDWAITLWRGTSIEVDESDCELLSKELRDDKTMPRVYVGQILRAMSRAKEAAK